MRSYQEEINLLKNKMESERIARSEMNKIIQALRKQQHHNTQILTQICQILNTLNKQILKELQTIKKQQTPWWKKILRKWAA